MAHNLAPLVEAKIRLLQRFSAKLIEQIRWIIGWITRRLLQPMQHASQDILGDVMPLRDPSRRGDPGGLPHVPNLAGVGLVSVHARGESQACVAEAVLGGLAQPLQRLSLATSDAAP